MALNFASSATVPVLRPAAGVLPALKPETARLLQGAVVPALLRMAAPTVALMAFQGIISAGEAAFVGQLGAHALAGVSLSFPIVMLMTTLSAGAFGGGVSSGVARAIGASKPDTATRIAGTGIGLALMLGALTTGVMLTFGRTIYSIMGAEGNVLDVASAYSQVVFSSAIPFWLFNAAASILRARGNAAFPAKVGTIAGVITLSVSPLLIFGWGSVPGLGIVGAASAIAAHNTAIAAVLLCAVWKEETSVPMSMALIVPRWMSTREILRVSLPSAANTIVTNLTFIILIGLVAPFGAEATAGYGVAGRLEFLLIPLVFGIGSAIVPLVAANEGAGNYHRVQQITFAGACLSATACGVVGAVVTIWPMSWMNLFTSDEAVSSVGSTYLRTVGPAFPCLGLGLSLFFAAQGRGRTLRPLAATLSRLTVAGIGGAIAVNVFGMGLETIFRLMSCGLAVYSLIMIAVMHRELGLKWPVLASLRN